MRGNGEGAFHLLEAQAGLGSEGQETDFTCCSASDLRESHPGHTQHRSFCSFCPAPGPGSLLGQRWMKVSWTEARFQRTGESPQSGERASAGWVNL